MKSKNWLNDTLCSVEFIHAVLIYLSCFSLPYIKFDELTIFEENAKMLLSAVPIGALRWYRFKRYDGTVSPILSLRVVHYAENYLSNFGQNLIFAHNFFYYYVDKY